MLALGTGVLGGIPANDGIAVQGEDTVYVSLVNYTASLLATVTLQPGGQATVVRSPTQWTTNYCQADTL